MTFAIDTDIPFPGIRPGVARYPWRQMKVGDSFFVAGKRGSNLHAGARQTGIRIITRKETVNGVDGLRVWRKA